VLNPIRTEPSGAYGVEKVAVLKETSGEENAVTKATPSGTTMAFGAQSEGITGPPVNGPAVTTLTCTTTGAAPAAS
jgi:hypothetical protein